MGVSTAQFFGYPAIISGTLKGMNFKFGRNIHRPNPSKRPLKILERRGHGHIQRLPNFLDIPYYFRNR